jgi:hypothetical protein
MTMDPRERAIFVGQYLLLAILVLAVVIVGYAAISAR